ncbi:ribosome bioproteinsis protein ytm1 [Curvularia kusanoi]|uniref:Ribosome bioproteinsis protein ytm1 n=1 Tax=Curvularia kusanoi TaxID=90978 RepID=A0A9P4T572_CURKU|nr:ribosome bioproteinsis protein ytm1 [Curvularia kusanoi]
MSSKVSHKQLGDAILQSAEHGSFPQDGDVASATVPSSALPELLETVGKAREEAREEVRKVSRDAASDVDGWISQARKLQDDIKRSQDTAKEIVQHAEEGKANTARVQDAASKVGLLNTEIAYNESLARVIEQLRDISTLLDSAQDAAVRGHVMYAIERLEDVDGAFESLGSFGSTRVVTVLKGKQAQMRKAIIEMLTDSWNGLLEVDAANNKVSLRDTIERGTTIEVNAVVEQLTKLGLLDKFVAHFNRDFDKTILSRRLVIGQDQVVTAFEIQGDDIQLTRPVNDGSVKATLEDIHKIAEFLSTRLPPAIALPLSAKLVPTIASRLINDYLLPAVPTSTDRVHDFQETLSYVLGLVEYLDELGWTGQSQLTEWVDRSAQIWLAKQKETAIAKVQKLFPKQVKAKKVVEKVETQIISKGDALHPEQEAQDEQDNDWGAEWGDEEESAKKDDSSAAPDVEEEDMSAWGMDEDEPVVDTKPESKSHEKETANEEDAEDWGDDWGDDEDAKSAPSPQAHTKSPQRKTNGQPAQQPPTEQHVTLRETYTVTAIPDSIIDIILQVVTDVETLNTPELAKSAISPASGGLFDIPSLLLAMYRATASVHYSTDVAANMLVYNDCERLSDRLRILIRELADKDRTSTLPRLLQPSTRLTPKLEADIKTIDGFSRRAYGKEMESQRQIIRDHLEDAQGFQGCTNVPFATVCDDAIATTIDRISDVKRQWQNIVSQRVLVQSLGSLVSTAFTKFINDVMDMSDIAEDESRKLHSYCMSLATLNQHFQTQDESGEIRDTASLYIQNWFRLQYLGEILAGSLADIKYLWNDSELKLEMGAEEVVGLIEALFAPSDLRRRAIAEIRRTSMQ